MSTSVAWIGYPSGAHEVSTSVAWIGYPSGAHEVSPSVAWIGYPSGAHEVSPSVAWIGYPSGAHEVPPSFWYCVFVVFDKQLSSPFFLPINHCMCLWSCLIFSFFSVMFSGPCFAVSSPVHLYCLSLDFM